MQPLAWERILRIAEPQHGVLTVAQLRRCDLSDGQIGRLVRSGRLIRLYRGIYRVAGSSNTFEQRVFAAILACGERAVASHRTALELRRLIEPDAIRRPDVTIPYGRKATSRLIAVHRSVVLGPRDVTTVGVIPVTRIARTIVEALPQIGADSAERALDEALRRRVEPPNAVLHELAAGTGVLREFALDRLGRGIPESELERRAIALIRRFGLPDPVRQHEVRTTGRTYRLDLAYPDHRVAVELMGRSPHWGRERWKADTDRRYDLDRAGWDVVELTHDHVTQDAVGSAFRIAEALGLEPMRWRSAAR